MPEFTVKYVAKWYMNNVPHYWFTQCGMCYNSKSGRLIKQVTNRCTIGYIIDGKFKSLEQIRPALKQFKKQTIPF